MKKTVSFHLIALMVLSMVSLPVQSAGQITEDVELSDVLDTKNAEHLILIAFRDHSIGRIQSRATAYRKRANYLSSMWSQRISDNIAEDYQLQKLVEWPMTAVGVHCIVYRVPANESVDTTLDRLGKDERVEIAQSMHLFKTHSREGVDPYSQLQSNLQALQVDEAQAVATGKNIVIAMIDTGADLEHPDLTGQISRNENFTEIISSGFAKDKHGTAVAGIMVAKKDNGIGIAGVAPDAKLIALKACWPEQHDAMEAVCNSFTLAMAVNAAINSGAQILNMSLAGPQDALLELLLNKAIANGMIVVAADTGDGKTGIVDFPASMKNVIPVRAMRSTENSRDTSLAAPSDKILTTLPYGTYDFISGSSIATAEVSGIIALLLEIKPDLTLAETQTLLQKSNLSAQLGLLASVNAKTAVLDLCATVVCPKQVLSLNSDKNRLDNLH